MEGFAVIGLIAGDLFTPELCPGLGKSEVAASFMPVPEAAVYQDDSLVPGEDNIWLAGKLTDMQPEPESILMKATPDQEFGSGILAPYTGHVVAPLAGRMYIRHRDRTIMGRKR